MSSPRNKKARVELDTLTLPDFGCTVIERPSDWEEHKVGKDANVDEYIRAVYAYGTSTVPENNSPRAVVFAKSEDDVKKAIEYAYKNKIAISCRSGGHQYRCYSSTTGNNITVDVHLMKTVTDEGEGIFRVGAGCTIVDVLKVTKDKHRFFPHGECSSVCMGGHMQTGGLSPFFSRSFGFMCDFITEFTIFLAPTKDDEEARKVIVTRPTKQYDWREESDENADLWFAVLGGSPGNFGIITEMKLRTLRDEDHADARAMTLVHFYDEGPENFAVVAEKIFDVVAEFHDKENLSADYVFNVIALGGNPTFDEMKNHNNNIDVMMHEEKNAGEKKFVVNTSYFPGIIGLMVNWNNTSSCGFSETDENGYCAEEIFEGIRKKLDPFMINPLDGNNYVGKMSTTETVKIFDRAKLDAILTLKEGKQRNLSELDDLMQFGPRYGANPYVGYMRWNLGKKLESTSWSKDTARILGDGFSKKDNGVWVTPQWTTTGGKHSMIRAENSNNPNSLCGRDGTMSNLYYLHYDNVFKENNDTNPRDLTKENVDELSRAYEGMGLGYPQFKKDLRWLAFCGEDKVLDDVQEHYYDSEDVYRQVLALKRKYDPKNVFTPNLFCVGAKEVLGSVSANL